LKLYIGNISYQSTESDLQDWFEQSGFPPDSVSIVRDRVSGESRGFGFVEVSDETGPEAVATLNGREFQGRTLVVNEARPFKPREGGGGGGGRSRGGGRDRDR
jgi:cold-inducible RNA-binding protein